MKTRHQFERMMKERHPEFFQENPEREVMDNLWQSYEAAGEGLRDGEPHSWDFPQDTNDPNYNRSMESWREGRTEEMMARAMGKALYARDQANKPPPVVDWDFIAATRSPHAEDVKRGKDRLSSRETVTRLRKEAERAERAGDPARARELHDMANAQERGDEGSMYSFQREYNKRLATDAEGVLRQAEKQGWITGDPEQYRGLATAFNHENEKDFSYAVRMSKDGSKFQIHSLEHAGVSGQRACIREGEDYLDNLMRLHFPEGSEERESEPAPEPTPDEGPWGNTQKQYEYWREHGKRLEEAEPTTHE